MQLPSDPGDHSSSQPCFTNMAAHFIKATTGVSTASDSKLEPYIMQRHLGSDILSLLLYSTGLEQVLLTLKGRDLHKGTEAPIEEDPTRIKRVSTVQGELAYNLDLLSSKRNKLLLQSAVPMSITDIMLTQRSWMVPFIPNSR